MGILFRKASKPVIRTKKKKRNNIVILISAENGEELKAIKEEFLISARRTARKQELGFYIAPIESALLKIIQEFANFSLEIPAGNR